ncbi:MAG: site-2 protease family protein, partial [Chloroflexi bacterium]|nr:site-2 protease family protein [Chloroflexota bacterium]
MSFVIVILIFLAIFAVLILAHEFGHFGAAKLSGVRVDEFGIGFPPRLIKKRRGETLYSLNLVPLGGFVKLLGEEGDPAGPRSFASKSIPVRFWILVAGPLMNLLLPILLFAISFMVPHNTIQEQVVIQEVASNSPAQMAGIAPGDTILEVNGHEIRNRGELSYYLQLGLGSEVNMLLQRPDLSQEEVSLVPRWAPPEGQGAIGVVVA